MEHNASPPSLWQQKGMDKEWLLTNHYGDYASGTMASCNTRRYHGLLAIETDTGRRMMLSELEDSVDLNGHTFPLSTRVHPDLLWPEGWKYLDHSLCTHEAVTFTYRLPDSRSGIFLTRRLALSHRRIRITYELEGTDEATLYIRPLASVRDVNHLYPADPVRPARVHALQPSLSPGFSYHPDPALPSLFMHVCQGEDPRFLLSPDWYYHILYPVEKARGYDWSEDLLMPGIFQAHLTPGHPVVLEAWADPAPETELSPFAPITYDDPLLDHLRQEADRFLVQVDGTPIVPAGYHWFGPWGRDTLISLPGLTFVPGRLREAEAVLRQICASVRHGLVPNLLGPGNTGESFNAADASLWFLLAIHRLYLTCPEERPFLMSHCWPVMKDMLRAFLEGTMPDDHGHLLVRTDTEGLLHVGSENTQLTWMDAMVDGKPVTPRHGCAVELNALWFDALTFAQTLARDIGEPEPPVTRLLPSLRQAFRRTFIPGPELAPVMHGGLFDTWKPGAPRDLSVRPNQIFAVSVPCSPLEPDEQASVVRCVRERLLTPFGLRTLASSDPDYRPHCQGDQRNRDLAYHQGTIWPWLLGAYADAVLKTDGSDRAALDLLEILTPLFTRHLNEAGMGSLSEIFDAEPPYAPGGCIAQAWSTSECLRLLLTVRKLHPQAWSCWRRSLANTEGGFGIRGSKEWICES